VLLNGSYKEDLTRYSIEFGILEYDIPQPSVRCYCILSVKYVIHHSYNFTGYEMNIIKGIYRFTHDCV